MAVSKTLEIPGALRPPTTGSSIKPPYSMSPKKFASGLASEIDVVPLPQLSKGGSKRVTFLPLATTTGEVDKRSGQARGESSIGNETFLLKQPGKIAFNGETVVGRGERSQINNNNSNNSSSSAGIIHKLDSSEVHLPIVSPRRSSLLARAAEEQPFRSSGKYDLEISRPIDVCSASTNSIFYTVPTNGNKSTNRTTAGRDFLGSPSIFKGFRDLQEPTRFVTVSKKKESASFSPLGALSWSKSTTSLTTKTGSPTAKRISRTKVARLNVNVVKPRLPKSASLQLAPQEPKIDIPEIKVTSEETPTVTMPIRVRMRRDEYYYMDTTSKSTQTDNENDESSTMSVSPFPGDQQSLSEMSSSSKVDRSTSPIQEIQPILANTPAAISRIEDLEKVTGHFVIQRFFTRTEQEFTSWLENQLGSSSRSMLVSAGVQVGEELEESESLTVPVLPPPPEIAVTEAPEVDSSEVEVPVPGPVVDEGRLTPPPPVIFGYEEPLAVELQDEVSKNEGEAETLENGIKNEEDRNKKEEDTTIEVFKRETQPEVVSEEPQNCQSTDLIKCECFASFFIHEENIARLLISLSPRASTMVTETNFFTTSTSVVTASVEEDDSTELKKERIAKFEALLTSTKSQMTRCSSKSKTSVSKYRKSKSTESIAAYSDQSLSCSETACEMFPDFVFPRPPSWRSEATTRRIRRSNSVDSCLGTDYSSVKTRYDSGTSTLGREKFSSEAFDLVQEGVGAKTTTTSIVEQFRTEISESVENKSQEALETPREKPPTSQRTSGRGRPKAANVRRAAAAKSRDVLETLSLDSETESDLIKSENYHARSEAESDDTDLTTTDGDAMVEDEIIYRRGETFTDEDEDDEDRRLFGLLSDEEDHLARKKLQMDKLRLDLEKTIRNTCTQTNRSLMSSAWSEVSGTSCSTTTDSCLDLEVVAKKYPAEEQLRGGKRHSYLPSSGSSLNYVNFSMNLNVKAEDAPKLKFSINLPGKKGKSPGGGASGGQRLQDRRSIAAGGGSKSTQQDLPSLWAHVRNRMDSTVGTIEGTHIPAYGDAKSGGGASGRSTRTGGAAAVAEAVTATQPKSEDPREAQPHQGKQPHQSLRHQQLLQNKAQKNSDRIKRSLARLSKLLETDESQRK